MVNCRHNGDEKDCGEAKLKNSTQLILVNGVEQPEISGLYEYSSSGVGLYDKVGGGGFLYTDYKSDQKRLIIGRGENGTSAATVCCAPQKSPVWSH